MISFRLFVRLARPHFLLGGALLYALGAGVARYQYGIENLDWGVYLLGQFWGTLIQLGTHFLNEFYDAPADADNENRTLFSGGSGALGEGKLPRRVALLASAACYTSAASLTVLFIRSFASQPAVFVFMALIFFCAFFYSAPPLRLVASGYGEFTTSLVVAVLTPALAFVLQTHELNRLLAMSTFPLAALHMAMMLVFELPDYASDLKHNKRTLMVRLGWQNGMSLHNALILLAFLLIVAGLISGMPAQIGLPALAVLPFGLLQIWNVNRIAAGGKPNWFTLTFAAISLFAASAFLLAFGFWIW